MSKISKMIALFVGGLCLVNGSHAIAADACAEGDEKCGAEGWVLRCEKKMTLNNDGETRWVHTTTQCKQKDSEGSSKFQSNSTTIKVR